MILCSELVGEQWKPCLHQVAKWTMASVDLLVEAGRNKEAGKEASKERFVELCNKGLEDLFDRGLLTKEEIEVMKGVMPIHRSAMLWVWICRLATKALETNGTPPPRTSAIANNCIKARDGVYNMGDYLETPLPFAYVHLITLLVTLQNLVVALKSGVVCAQQFGSWGGTLVIMQEMFMTIVVCTIYQGLLQISYTVINPFGDDMMDFPVRSYMAKYAQATDALLRAQAECPAWSPSHLAELLPKAPAAKAAPKADPKPPLCTVAEKTGTEDVSLKFVTSGRSVGEEHRLAALSKGRCTQTQKKEVDQRIGEARLVC